MDPRPPDDVRLHGVDYGDSPQPRTPEGRLGERMKGIGGVKDVKPCKAAEKGHVERG